MLGIATNQEDGQKQPSKGILRKRCSENIQKIYRRTPMPKCDFNKVVYYRAPWRNFQPKLKKQK